MELKWRIELLGGLRATRGNRVITRFKRQKAGALLAYLACHRERPQPRQVLIELLWPECDEETGRHSLSVALSSLREQLDDFMHAADPVIRADRFSVGLNPVRVTTDVEEWERALQAAAAAANDAERARLLTEAVELHRGTLLPGYFEEWILPEQQRLEERLCQALTWLVAHFEGADRLDRAIEYARRAVSVDPLREEAHGELIRLYAAAGQPSAALRQYQELERVLQQKLQIPPGSALRALAEQISVGAGSPPSPAAGENRLEISVSSPTPVPPARILEPEEPAEQVALVSPRDLEPVGGAVPLDSRFYIARLEDAEFSTAISRQDSIVLVKGSRQVGKTSLLVRGIQQARAAGARVVLTDFQVFNAAHLESADTLLIALAQSIAEWLDLDVSPAEVWDPRRGPNPNFRRYLRREVLTVAQAPVVWGLDEVDRLFSCPFGSEIFGLFRSWHNERALDPTGPWSRLTLTIAYATEAHLFITDVHQSPFNVGTRLTLDDFNLAQVAELNRRYGAPLQDEAEVGRFYDIVGGHPYLVRRGLHEMAGHGIPLTEFGSRAGSGEWIYGDHLRRILLLLQRDPALCEVVRGVLAGHPCPTAESFYRLRSAGVLAGEFERDTRLRCRLYSRYLERHLL